MADLLDSGSKRHFDTGAVRDMADGKGRCDLLPIDTVAKITGSRVLSEIYNFVSTKDCCYLLSAIQAFVDEKDSPFQNIYDAIIESSFQYEDGAKKYGENNWKLGMQIHNYIDSGIRHYLKFKRGDKDEPHHRAFVWNMICCAWTTQNKPELFDMISETPIPNEVNKQINPESQAQKNPIPEAIDLKVDGELDDKFSTINSLLGYWREYGEFIRLGQFLSNFLLYLGRDVPETTDIFYMNDQSLLTHIRHFVRRSKTDSEKVCSSFKKVDLFKKSDECYVDVYSGDVRYPDDNDDECDEYDDAVSIGTNEDGEK